MVSGFACFSGLQQFDFFCFCRTEIHCFWQEVEAKPQWCGILFSADQFLYSFGGFTRNLREAFCFTTEYYKKDWKCILSSDFCCYWENKQWGQQTMNTWWFISMHIRSVHLWDKENETYDWNKHTGTIWEDISGATAAFPGNLVSNCVTSPLTLESYDRPVSWQLFQGQNIQYTGIQYQQLLEFTDHFLKLTFIYLLMI